MTARCHSVRSEGAALGKAERDVHGLDRGTGRALDEVVDSGDDDDPACGPVDREPEERSVGPDHVGRARDLSLRQQLDERLVGVRQLPGRADVGIRGARSNRRGGSRKDSAGHRDDDGREGDPDVGPSGILQRLTDLGDVPVCAADRIRVRAAEHFACQQVRFEALPCPRRADGEHADDVARIDHAGSHPRRERQTHRRGVAAGCGDASRAREGVTDLPARDGQLGNAVDPGLRVRPAVELLPRCRIAQPVIGAGVDHEGHISEGIRVLR